MLQLNQKREPAGKIALKKPLLFLISGLVCIVIAGGGVYYWHHKSLSSGTNASEPYLFVYKKLSPYYLSGQTVGAGIKLNIPNAFSSLAGSSGKYSQVNYSQIYIPNGPLPKNFVPTQIAHFAAASLYSPVPFTADFKDNYSANLASTSEQTGLQTFLDQRLPSGYSVTLGIVKNLTTPNIGSHAWIISYTAKARPGQDTSVLPDLAGEVIIVLGKQTTYYLMLDAINTNWRTNQIIWPQITDSIRIDQ